MAHYNWTLQPASCAWALIAGLCLGSTGPAFATDFTVQNGQTVSRQTLDTAGDTGTIDAGGLL